MTLQWPLALGPQRCQSCPALDECCVAGYNLRRCRSLCNHPVDAVSRPPFQDLLIWQRAGQTCSNSSRSEPEQRCPTRYAADEYIFATEPFYDRTFSFCNRTFFAIALWESSGFL